MRKRRTTRGVLRPEVRILQARVSSPRIVFYDSQKTLVLLCKILLMSAAVGGLAYLLWLGLKRAVFESDEFRLQELVINENPVMDEARFCEVTGIRLDTSMFQLSANKIRQQLEECAEIKQANVIKEFPGRLEVEVVPREPDVWISCEAMGIMPRNQVRGLLADAEGILFPCRPQVYETIRHLPVIEISGQPSKLKAGEKIQEPDYLRGIRLYNIAREADPSAEKWVDLIRKYKSWGTELITRSGTVAVFGNREMEREMQNFFAAVRHAEAQGKQLASIRLIGRRNIPVMFQNNEEEKENKPDERPQIEENAAYHESIDKVETIESEDDEKERKESSTNNLDLQILLER